jgi:hypothetical protein
MSSPLANTLLQWNVSQCLDEKLHGDLMITIPLEFQDIPSWSGSFDIHIYDEMRDSLGKVFESFLRIPTQFNLRSSPDVTSNHNPFRTLYCHADIDRNSFEESIVIFVETSSSELDTESLKRTKHFLADMRKLQDKYRTDLDNVELRLHLGDLQRDFIRANGAGWTLYILDETSLPLDRIMCGLRSFNKWNLPPNMETELLACDCRLSSSDDEILSVEVELTDNAAACLRDLNSSQKLAVLRVLSAGVLGPHLQVIHGPPGTGKTNTLVGLIGTLLHQSDTDRIHATAPTNYAICEVTRRALRLLDSTTTSLSSDRTIHKRHFLLMGNHKRLKMCPLLEEIHVNSILDRLANAAFGWSEFMELKTLLQPVNDADRNTASPVLLESVVLKTLMQPVTAPDHHTSHSDDALSRLERCLEHCIAYTVSVSEHLPDSLLDPRSRECIALVGRTMTQLLLRMGVGARSVPSSEKEGQSLEDSLLDLLSSDLFRRFQVHRFSALPDQMKQKVLIENARVVFSTVSQAGSSINSSLKHFDVVIIDEATQLVEAATAIMFSPRLRCLVLAGDNKQLPATVNSSLAEKQGYGRSLFERLLLHDFPSSLLNTQYRMHPMISVWPNKRFYRGKIVDGENVRSSTYTKEWHFLLPPFSMYDVKGTEELDLSKSYYNRLEVSTVKSVLRSLYGILKESVRRAPLKVGVISAYKAQATLMRESMAQMSDAFDSSLISLHSSTVDGFQGQECDVIIFLCVRCNPQGSIGFLSDSRRLTVALTRAKYSLLVIGDCSTLKHHDLWNDLITYASGRSAVYDRTTLSLIKNIGDKYALEARKLASKDPSFQSNLFDLSPWGVKIMEMFKKTFPSMPDATSRRDLEYCLVRLSEGKWPWKPQYPAGIEPEVGNFEDIIYSSVIHSRVLLWSLDLEVQRFQICSP